MALKATPLVSVVIPYLNVGTFLEEAIESVLKQTYPNWEIVLLDDGSTDLSSEIGKKYAASHPGKITYGEHPHHANRGVCASRNHAITMTKGDYLAFLDGDDVWLPDKLEAQMEIFEAYPQTELLCEAAEYWYYADDSTPNMILQVGKEQDRLFYPPELIDQIYPLGTSQAPCPSGIMIRKAAVLRNGGFEEHFTGKNQMYEDQAFLVKMYLNETIYICSKHHHLYRQRVGSLVQTVDADGIYQQVRHYFLQWMENYLAEKKIKNKKVDALLRRAFEPYRNPYKTYVKKMVRKMVQPFR